ncbi:MULTISPECIES: hypothetical protein [Sulfurimonas]|uniref:Uncharacterized protein n=1 Tax=Sulfurimonas marina TaxID=2590551 RepID=A0A7M3V995_9BACT|nr:MULTISPECIES: hypothetical protein [Sulfurimonas]QOP40328.1 hypothetical protein FJR03_00645 [Sulfurimonas marina]
MWLNELKVAIIQKDVAQLEKLLDETPQLEKKEDIESAIYLFKAAIELLETLKSETATSMKQIKKNIDFLNSTKRDSINSLDITS